VGRFDGQSPLPVRHTLAKLGIGRGGGVLISDIGRPALIPEGKPPWTSVMAPVSALGK